MVPGRSRLSGRMKVIETLSCAILAGGFLVPAAAAPAASPPSAPAATRGDKTLQDLENDLRRALVGKDSRAAAAAVDAIAALDSVDGAEVLIRQALKGVNFAVEKRAQARLAASGNAAVWSKIIEQARKNASYRTRILLLDVLGGKGENPAVLKTFHAALADPVRPVVFVALRWILKLGKKESVEPLIAQLAVREKERQGRIYHDIRKTLKALTTFDLETAGEWKSFWEARKKGLSRPATSGGEESSTAVRSHSFFSIALNSDRVLFVIDTSGSMNKRDAYPPKTAATGKGTGRSGKTGVRSKRTPAPSSAEQPLSRERLWRVKTELVRAVNSLQPSIRFGILAFNHQIHYAWRNRGLESATSAAKRTAVRWVKALRPSGATRTDLALQRALTTPEVDTIVLLTDGAPKNEKNQRINPDAILRQVKAMNRFANVRIHTISFQQIRDTRMRRFVRNLSLENDGGEPVLLP